MFAASGRAESAEVLAREIASRAPKAVWAWKRLGKAVGSGVSTRVPALPWRCAGI